MTTAKQLATEFNGRPPSRRGNADPRPLTAPEKQNFAARSALRIHKPETTAANPKTLVYTPPPKNSIAYVIRWDDENHGVLYLGDGGFIQSLQNAWLFSSPVDAHKARAIEETTRRRLDIVAVTTSE